MRRKVYSIFLTICLIALITAIAGCSQTSKDDVISDAKKSGFAIYKVKKKDGQVVLSFGSYQNEKYIDGKKVDLADVETEGEPLLTDKDIKKYHWKTHVIELTDEFVQKRKLTQKDREEIQSSRRGFGSGRIHGGSVLIDTVDTDAVVITVGGRKIYTAGFMLSMLSSRCPAEITIDDYDFNALRISNKRQSDDVRQDKAIYDFFKKAGKLVD